MEVTGNIAQHNQHNHQGIVRAGPEDSEVCVIYGRRPETAKGRAH